MKKQSALKVVNPLMGVLLLNQFLTGTFHLDLSDYMFTFVHEWSGYVLFCLGIVHLALNWGWVKAQFLQRRRSAKT